MKSAFAPILFLLFPTTTVIGQESNEMPKEVRKELNHLVGNWAGKLSAGDQEASVTFKARWSDSNDAIIWEWTSPLISTKGDAGKFTVKGTGLMGWDALTNQIKELSFNNLSETISRTYEVDSAGNWIGTQSGTYRTDDMKKHVPMKGKVSIRIMMGRIVFKESAEYEGELFRDVSITMHRM